MRQRNNGKGRREVGNRQACGLDLNPAWTAQFGCSSCTANFSSKTSNSTFWASAHYLGKREYFPLSLGSVAESLRAGLDMGQAYPNPGLGLHPKTYHV